MPNDEVRRRLAEIAGDTVTGAAWREALHPRARDGRFIEKGGWVRGLFSLFSNNDPALRNGKVMGFRRGPAGVMVDVETKDGPATAPAKLVTEAVAPKAFLSPSTPWVPKPPLTREQRVARVNAMAEDLPEDDLQGRVALLNKITSGLRGTPLSTIYQHNKLGKTGDGWSPERLQQHQDLWDRFIANVERANVPKDYKAVVLGGLPGSGKSSSLLPGGPAGEHGIVGWDTIGEPPEGVTHVVLNPDTLKELMADSGMNPTDISPKIKPMEQAAFTHAESNFLVSLFFQRLADEGYNVVYDTTMANVPHVSKNLAPLAEEGYRFKGLFFDIPREESKLSTKRRYAQEFQTPKGGRFVPPEAGTLSSARGYRSANADVFEDMTSWFEDGWTAYNNIGISKGEPLGEVLAEGVGNGFALSRFRPIRPGGLGGVPTRSVATDIPVDPDGKVRTDDVQVAARALAQGLPVELAELHQVSTLLDQLHANVQEAIALGEDAPFYDLCQVTVPGTNLFCVDNAGIPRVKMPQLRGTPVPGSRADSMPKLNGKVDLSEAFRAHLESLGHVVTDDEIPASHMKATQSQLDGKMVARLTAGLRDKDNTIPLTRTFISTDDYIVDGHHRWAATVGLDSEDDALDDLTLPVARIDMPITELIDEANRFAAEMGIPPKTVAPGDTAPPPVAAAGDDDLLTIYGINHLIRRGQADTALQILQNNGAYVDDEDVLPEGAGWDDEGSAASVKSILQHELDRAGSGDLWPQFDEEVARLRREGYTMSALVGQP